MRHWLLLSLIRFINLQFKIINRIWYYIYHIDLLNEALWLGVLSKKSHEKLLKQHYKITKKYTRNENTEKGLFNWEKKIANTYIRPNSIVTIIAAGGGREAYALAKKDCIISAYESDKKMVDYANEFFKNKTLDVSFSHLEFNSIPIGNCNTFWFGWGVYTHFIGQNERVRLLKEASMQLLDNGYIIISYWSERRSHDRINRIQSIAQRMNSRTIDKGESFRQAFWGKYYSQEQIIKEAIMADLKVIYISNQEYGHAVLKKNINHAK